MLKWIFVILGLVGLDQITKIWVVNHFSDYAVDVEKTIPVIEDFFHITYTRNTGVVFGFFEGIAEDYVILLVLITVALTIFVMMFLKVDFKDKRLFWYGFALSLLIAGALGNGIDRLFQSDHAVIDMIDFRGIWDYIFNIADICLNVGIGLFIFDQFILEPKRNPKKDGKLS